MKYVFTLFSEGRKLLNAYTFSISEGWGSININALMN